MKIIVKDEEELVKIAEEALHILSNLRKFTKLWEDQYGSILKTKKKRVEKSADEFLDKLKVQEHVRLHEVKIDLNAGGDI